MLCNENSKEFRPNWLYNYGMDLKVECFHNLETIQDNYKPISVLTVL